MKPTSAPASLAPLLQRFFCQHLIQQRNASPQTVASYRDTFRLLLQYLADIQKKKPASITLTDLDVPAISAFLNHLEKQRRNSIRTRNTRFAAIRSFLSYSAALDPVSLPSIQRVLAMPMKRFSRPILNYLSRDEVAAILESPDASTFSGQRDRMLFSLLYNTGARITEMLALRRGDVLLDSSRHVHVTGKGRKHRIVPLWKSTCKQLRGWMLRIDRDQESPLFPNKHGQPLTRSGAEKRLQKAVHVAASRCPTLRTKCVSPHTFRHTTAMHLLQSGVDITMIAIWLGHERLQTSHQYIQADLAMKEKALSKLTEIPQRRIRYQASDKLLKFLEGL